MTERVIMAGFGGQGMMLLGKLLAQAATNEGRELTFFPSYGAEVRGGTAHCHVIISDEPIYSPHVEEADTLIIMNQPSYDKFRSRLRPDGLLLLNAGLTDPVEAIESASPARILSIPSTQIANDDLGAVRVANMIMMGAYMAVWNGLPTESVWAVIEAAIGKKKAHLLDVNRKAFEIGAEHAAAFNAA